MALFRGDGARAAPTSDLLEAANLRLLDAKIAQINAKTRDIRYARWHKFIATILGFVLGLLGVFAKPKVAPADINKPVPVERSATPQVQGERRSGGATEDEEEGDSLPRDEELDSDTRVPHTPQRRPRLQLAVNRYSQRAKVLEGWLWDPSEVSSKSDEATARHILGLIRMMYEQELSRQKPNPVLLKQLETWKSETEAQLRRGPASI